VNDETDTPVKTTEGDEGLTLIESTERRMGG